MWKPNHGHLLRLTCCTAPAQAQQQCGALEARQHWQLHVWLEQLPAAFVGPSLHSVRVKEQEEEEMRLAGCLGCVAALDMSSLGAGGTDHIGQLIGRREENDAGGWTADCKGDDKWLHLAKILKVKCWMMAYGGRELFSFHV